MQPPVNGSYGDPEAGRDGRTALTFELDEDQRRPEVRWQTVERGLKPREHLVRLQDAHRVRASARQVVRGDIELSIAARAGATAVGRRGPDGDFSQVGRLCGRSPQVTPVAVNDQEDLLHRVVELVGRDPEPR